jgi:hypothetical protein
VTEVVVDGGSVVENVSVTGVVPYKFSNSYPPQIDGFSKHSFISVE